MLLFQGTSHKVETHLLKPIKKSESFVIDHMTELDKPVDFHFLEPDGPDVIYSPRVLHSFKRACDSCGTISQSIHTSSQHDLLNAAADQSEAQGSQQPHSGSQQPHSGLEPQSGKHGECKQSVEFKSESNKQPQGQYHTMPKQLQPKTQDNPKQPIYQRHEPPPTHPKPKLTQPVCEQIENTAGRSSHLRDALQNAHNTGQDIERQLKDRERLVQERQAHERQAQENRDRQIENRGDCHMYATCPAAAASRSALYHQRPRSHDALENTPPFPVPVPVCMQHGPCPRRQSLSHPLDKQPQGDGENYQSSTLPPNIMPKPIIGILKKSKNSAFNTYNSHIYDRVKHNEQMSNV